MSKFKVGDKVKIVKKVTERTDDFQNSWTDPMDVYIGKVFTILSISRSGVRFEEDAYYGFPPASLEFYKQEETKMRKFDIESAKNGAKILTRDGRPVRILAYDRKDRIYPIIGLVLDGEEEILYSWKINGSHLASETTSDTDLFIAPTIKYGLYDTEDCEMASYLTHDTHAAAEKYLDDKYDPSSTIVVEISI